MRHTFFDLTPKAQRFFQLKLVASFVFANLLFAALSFLIGLPFFIVFFFSLSLTIIAPFIDVPAGVKAGSLVYYSPLLLGEKIRNNRLVLHSGSLFDYYFVLDRKLTAQHRKKRVFNAYVAGLLKLIEQFENQQTNQITIKATSYILNPRTAKKIGLKRVESDSLQKLILYYNYINLTCALSLLNNKFTWPKMQQIYTYEGSLDTLISKKADLLGLQQKFEKH